MADDGPDPTHELYALDPNDFVAARNELARTLRKAGDKALAADVAKLRRPTPAAWALNQLVRRHRDEVEELVHLGQQLRAAQDEALGGGEPANLRQAGRARRDAVAKLAERAEAILAERGGSPGAHAADVTATLEAASLDAEAADEVLAGRLATELQPPSGFGVFDLTVAPARPAPKPEPEPAPDTSEPEAEPDKGPSERELRKAEDAAAEARRRWEEKSEQARTAVERVEQSRRSITDAEAEVARLEELLSEAERRLRGAVRNAELAEDAASRAEDAAARAGEALREADQRLADLGGS